MAQDRPDKMERFPPTVVGHTNYKNGIELELLDSGTEEDPRYVWIPDEGESNFVL